MEAEQPCSTVIWLVNFLDKLSWMLRRFFFFFVSCVNLMCIYRVIFIRSLHSVLGPGSAWWSYSSIVVRWLVLLASLKSPQPQHLSLLGYFSLGPTILSFSSFCQSSREYLIIVFNLSNFKLFQYSLDFDLRPILRCLLPRSITVLTVIFLQSSGNSCFVRVSFFISLIVISVWKWKKKV